MQNQDMRVKQMMESDVVMISPSANLREAAQKMREANCGFLPVGEKGQKPQGVITDRDIVVRALAEGKDPSQCKVSEYMSEDVCCCEQNDSLEDAAHAMNENEVSRLLVQDESGEICGVLTFGRIIRNHGNPQELGSIVTSATSHAA